MATPAATAGLLAAAPRVPRRAGRWQPLLLLVAFVLGWHAWLAGVVVPAARPAGPPRPGLVQLRSIPPVQVAQPEVPVAEAPVAALPRPTANAAAPATARREATAAISPATTVAAPVDAQPLQAVQGMVEQASSPSLDAGPDGAAPPVYPTRLPPPAQLRYALRLNGQPGEALLDWQHDGQHYRLSLDGWGLDGAPLMSQASQGQVDAHGLAPDRYVDSRRGGRRQAANFRRDIGRIGYSGPPQQHPAWPGAQDRLSWLAQLAAVLAAADGTALDAVHLFITDARGHAGLWQLQRQPDATGATPWGEALLQHWQREPPRPEGLRVDLWLAAGADTAAGGWPVRLRLQVPRSGDVVDLELLAAP